MAALTASPTALSVLIRTPGGAFTPVNIRAVTGSHRQAATRQLTISGADATLVKVGGASWLAIPAESTDGVGFDVTVDASSLAAARDFSETIRASAGGWDDVDVVISLAVRPEGPGP